MYTVLLILILLGPLISAVTAFRALSGLPEVPPHPRGLPGGGGRGRPPLCTNRRAGEQPRALDARATELPSRSLQSLTTLQVRRERWVPPAPGAEGSLLQRAKDAQRRPLRQDAPDRFVPEEQATLRVETPVSKTRRILRNMDEESVQQVQTTEALKPSGEDCEVCGGDVRPHCKLICPNCGYRRDCSDP